MEMARHYNRGLIERIVINIVGVAATLAALASLAFGDVVILIVSVIIVIACIAGSKRPQKVWKCTNCGAIAPRM